MSKKDLKITGEKLQSILDDLFAGKVRKNICADHDISSTSLSHLEGRFPLFFGLRREYNKREENG